MERWSQQPTNFTRPIGEVMPKTKSFTSHLIPEKCENMWKPAWALFLDTSTRFGSLTALQKSESLRIYTAPHTSTLQMAGLPAELTTPGSASGAAAQLLSMIPRGAARKASSLHAGLPAKLLLFTRGCPLLSRGATVSPPAAEDHQALPAAVSAFLPEGSLALQVPAATPPGRRLPAAPHCSHASSGSS